MRHAIALLLATAVTSAPPPQQTAVTKAIANDNRPAAGRMAGDSLVLRLTVTPAAWHLLGESEPAFRVLAFAEEGKAPTIPGPLLRVRVGTPIHVQLRNPLDDTLIVRGLSHLPAAVDSLVVLPRATTAVRFVARRAGTYLYWAIRRPVSGDRQPSVPARRGFDSQLAGALVVDPPGVVPDDRILVITELGDRVQDAASDASRDRHGTPLRQFNAVNGMAWPHTERFHHAVGDSIRWRIVNASPEVHPMHLHGFFFRVDSRGTPQAEADSIYTPAQRRMAVTESITARHTASIVWSPDRPGGWLFHCHLTSHVVKLPPVDRPDAMGFPSHHEADPDRHAVTGLNGLVVGITVTGRPTAPEPTAISRRLRLFVQSDSAPGDTERRFGYVLQRGAEPKPDSVEFPGPVLVLTRGEPTSVAIVNRSGEPTAVHWHGIELDSYFDGVAGWSGTRGRIAPAVRSGQTFEVRITPRRAGTFMYHTHFDEIRQQYGGLVGALIVLEPGERWNPSRDLLFLMSDGVPRRTYVNGSLTPKPIDLETGTTYRLRLADLAVFRMTLSVRLMRDSSLLSWRPIAKDGFALPAHQATMRPSVTNLPSGETADFEFTPDQPGELVLEIGASSGNLPTNVRLRVSAKPTGMRTQTPARTIVRP